MTADERKILNRLDNEIKTIALDIREVKTALGDYTQVVKQVYINRQDISNIITVGRVAFAILTLAIMGVGALAAL
ncbi:MAG: hypothetical protein K9N34_03670 [Candidatus Marinimicrobia bacterium]|nr:hypothetical protein [Candidatus Neomarinimicrobiota bacterium]MCF7839793.1 hypothetical protein [Candidatus Neomarinimicrobiota bacterium]